MSACPACQLVSYLVSWCAWDEESRVMWSGREVAEGDPPGFDELWNRRPAPPFAWLGNLGDYGSPEADVPELLETLGCTVHGGVQ